VQPVFAFLARQKPDGSRINSLVRKIGVVRFSTHVRSRAQLVGFTIMIESGVLTVRLGSTPSTSRRLAFRSRQDPMTQRQRELDRERRWELYRRSVIERMPESDYKTAVLAGIAHKLMMLDRMEASQSRSIDKAARTRTDWSRGLARAARNGRNG
jgi:hypothetical protein